MARPAKRAEIRIIPVAFADEIRPGDNVAEKLITTLADLRLVLAAGDILVVKHKIVSKAEGRFVPLEDVRPSAQSRLWAKRYRLDARVVEVALAESKADRPAQEWRSDYRNASRVYLRKQRRRRVQR